MAGGGQTIYTDEEKAKVRDDQEYLRKMRKKNEAAMTGAFSMFIKGSKTHENATEVVKAEMRAKINDDALADKLIPDFALGCRRFTV
jgi:hypothetical protein